MWFQMKAEIIQNFYIWQKLTKNKNSLKKTKILLKRQKFAVMRQILKSYFLLQQFRSWKFHNTYNQEDSAILEYIHRVRELLSKILFAEPSSFQCWTGESNKNSNSHIYVYWHYFVFYGTHVARADTTTPVLLYVWPMFASRRWKFGQNVTDIHF